MKVIFSPCLYCTDNKIYDLFLLNDTLKFIVDYLDASLDDYEEAFYNDNRLYMPPIMETTAYLQYMSIIENIYKLKTNGTEIILNLHNTNYVLQNPEFQISNSKEFQILIDYLYQLYNENCDEDIIMFFGETNDKYTDFFLNILINNINFSIPVVGNPFLDKTGNFDKYIKEIIDDFDEPFKYKQICCQLADEMNQKVLTGQRNGSLYKKYGEIIALRNKFSIYHPQEPYDEDTIYFISYDKYHIISIDLKHGHYEVFDNTNKKLWIAKYDIYGKEIDRPTDPKKLKSIRNNHKVEK